MKMGDVARGWLGELPAYLLHLGGAQPKTSREPVTYCSSVASCRRAWVRHLVTPNQQIYPCIPCPAATRDRKSTRLNSSHQIISYAVFCFKKKNATPDSAQ